MEVSDSILSSYVAQGRTVLQPHQLLDQLSDDQNAADIKASAFGKLLDNCQVKFSEIVVLFDIFSSLLCLDSYLNY